jgi:predicted acetyltransferase
MLQRILKDLSAENIEKVFIGCKPSNTASIKSIKKAGFAPLRKIRAVSLFGKKIGARTIQLR